MRLWRITSHQWALDRQCEGARQFGGRWNPPGTAALYAATTVELCALEKFVHVGAIGGAVQGIFQGPRLVLVAIDLPDDPELIHSAETAKLPSNWAALPAPANTQNFGQQWLDASSGLALLLPSAVVPESHIALINPRHFAFQHITMHIVRPFMFDRRMFG